MIAAVRRSVNGNGARSIAPRSFALDFPRNNFKIRAMQIVLDSVTKVFSAPRGEAIRAVRNLSLTVGENEFLVLVGPTGCGKTTVLRLIAGLEEVTHGKISFGDKCVNGVEPKDRDVAMVFQNGALFPHMTAFENMAFGLRLRKVPHEEIRKRVNDAAANLGISELLDRKPASLSGGQRQRVALGRAIVRQPKIFLFDEPLSNLDPITRKQIRREIVRLHAKLRVPMIYVTHDEREALSLGRRIAVMRDGELQQVGTAEEIQNRPVNKFVAEFFAPE